MTAAAALPGETPGQTVGPFFHIALPWPGGEHLVGPGSPAAVRLTGIVLDGAGRPVPDALVEIRQADSSGVVPLIHGSLRRDEATFTGFGRAATDSTGRFAFTTLRPGPTAAGALPFFAIAVFARGLLNRLFTRAYLPAPAERLVTDPLLGALRPDRRATMLIREDGTDLHFDIRLQGEGETVFLSPRQRRVTPA